jgi:hypothetical protein
MINTPPKSASTLKLCAVLMLAFHPANTDSDCFPSRKIVAFITDLLLVIADFCCNVTLWNGWKSKRIYTIPYKILFVLMYYITVICKVTYQKSNLID